MDYTIGQTVTYIAGGEVAQDESEPVVATGVVNGEPIQDGDNTWVPVWTRRDHGREATTIYVHGSNIL